MLIKLFAKKTVVVIDPVNLTQYQNLKLEYSGNGNVKLTADFGPRRRFTAVMPLKELWKATFLKMGHSKRISSTDKFELSKDVSHEKMLSVVKLGFEAGRVSVYTSDIRLAYQLIKYIAQTRQ
jgi:hypothetical protein